MINLQQDLRNPRPQLRLPIKMLDQPVGDLRDFHVHIVLDGHIDLRAARSCPASRAKLSSVWRTEFNPDRAMGSEPCASACFTISSIRVRKLR